MMGSKHEPENLWQQGTIHILIPQVVQKNNRFTNEHKNVVMVTLDHNPFRNSSYLESSGSNELYEKKIPADLLLK